MADTNSSLKEAIFQIFTDVLGVDTADVHESSTRDDFEGWDSLGHIRLISDVESRFGITLTVEQIEELHTVADVIKCVEALTSAGA
jgi:acyl carrier protein